MNLQKLRFHYGWVICGACMLMLACSAGMIMNTFGIFLKPICDELGVSRTSVSLCQTMMSAAGLLTSLFSAWLYRRFKLLNLMRLASLTACVCCALFTRTDNVIVMTILAFGMGLGASLMSWVPVSVLISNWFREKRGFVFGIAATGSGIGGMLFSFLGGLLLERLGWRTTFLLFSGIAATITLPVTLLVIKTSPYDVGLRPFGDETNGAQEAELTGPGMKRALAMPRFYLILLGIFVMGFGANALNGTLSSYMNDSGFPTAFSSFMFTLYMAVIIPGKLLLGWAFDRLGMRWANFLGLCGMSLTALLLALMQGTGMGMAIAASAVMGLGLAIGSLMAPVLTREAFGTRDYAGMSGLATAASTVGGVLSLTIMGIINDAVGSYRPAYWGLAIAVLLVAVGLLPLTKKQDAQNS